jgi:acetyl esterase
MAEPLADSALTAFMAELNAQPAASAAETDPRTLRARGEERAAARPKGPEMQTVRDVAIGPDHIPARLYRPAAGPTALVVYLHGGGWVIGSIDTADRACRRLAAAAGSAVLSLGYRLAPEHPWPAAVDDAMAALEWAASPPPELGPPPPAVGIAGDSAGGAVAALACLRARDQSPQVSPAVQALIYANTDLTNSGASMRTKGHGFGLEAEAIEWFSAQWVPDSAMRADPRVSPLCAPDLTGLPAAIVITCEHDPLRDQGEAYAARLRDAGVLRTGRREQGMVHNFMYWDLISPACAAAADRVAADLRSALATASGRSGGVPRQSPGR